MGQALAMRLLLVNLVVRKNERDGSKAHHLSATTANPKNLHLKDRVIYLWHPLMTPWEFNIQTGDLDVFVI